MEDKIIKLNEYFNNEYDGDFKAILIKRKINGTNSNLIEIKDYNEEIQLMVIHEETDDELQINTMGKNIYTGFIDDIVNILKPEDLEKEGIETQEELLKKISEVKSIMVEFENNLKCFNTEAIFGNNNNNNIGAMYNAGGVITKETLKEYADSNGIKKYHE